MDRPNTILLYSGI